MDDAFPLAAVEEVPQEHGSLEWFGNSANNIIGCDDGFVAFRVAWNARFAFGPVEHGSFGHARDGKRQMGIPRQEFRRVESFKKRGDQMLRGVVRRKARITAGDLPRRGMKNRDEGQKEHVAQKGVRSVPVPQAKHFEENRVGGMPPVTIAAAGAQMGTERGSGRITGQQRIGQSNACVLFLATRFAQFLFQMDFELAEKTTASGTSSHNRPPGWPATGPPHGLRASLSGAHLEFSVGSGGGADSGAA